MGVILDTSVWVNVERGRLAPADVARYTRNEPVYAAPPIIAELEYGVSRARTPAQRQKRAAAVSRIKRKPCLIIDRDTGACFGRLAAELDNAGTPHRHRVHDLWLAALAIQHNLKLLTHDAHDFQDVPGLQLITLPSPPAR